MRTSRPIDLQRVTWTASHFHRSAATLSVAALLSLLASGPVRAEKRARTRPQPVIDSAWPTGTVRRLKLSHDGRRTWLYAAGVGKVVRRWEVIRQGGRVQLREAGTYAWPIYRAERGVIAALDVLPGKAAGNRPALIVVGGIGTQSPHVALLRSDQPETPQVLVDPVPTNNARQAVYSVAFAPNGQLLAVGEQGTPCHDRGRVLLWDIRGPRAVFLGRMETGAESVRCLKFSPRGDYLATAGARPPADGQPDGSLIELWETAQLRRKFPGQNINVAPLSQTQIPSIDWKDSVPDSLCWIGNTDWAAATLCGIVRGLVPKKIPAPLQVEAETRLIMPPFGLSFSRHEKQFCELINETDQPVTFEFVPGNRRVKILPGMTHREQDPAPGLKFCIAGHPDLANPVLGGYRCRFGYESWGIEPVPGTTNVVVGIRDASKDVSRLVIQNQAGRIITNVPDSGFRQDALHAFSVLPAQGGHWPLLAAAGRTIVGGRAFTQIRLWELGQPPQLLGVFPEMRPQAAIPPVNPKQNPPLPETGGPIAVAAVAEDGYGILWDYEEYPPQGKFGRGFDPDIRGVGIRPGASPFGRMNPVVPVQSASDVIRVNPGAQAVRLNPQGNPQVLHVFRQQQYFTIDRIENGPNGRPQFYRVRGRLPGVKGRFFRLAANAVQLVRAQRWHDLQISDQRVDSGRVVLMPDTPLRNNPTANSRRLQGLQNGLYLVPLETKQNWYQFNTGGDIGWLHADDALEGERWDVLDAAGNRVALVPVLKGTRPLCAARLLLDGRDLLAVGHERGIQVWDLQRLSNGSGRGALLRAFYGHADHVSSLSFSPDGGWLLTSSLDGTLCGWSLEGLGTRPELDVRIKPGNAVPGAVVQNSPPRGTPAWEAGFQQNQPIRSVLLGGRLVDPAQWQAVLGQTIPGDEIVVTLANGDTLQTPVQNDPLWTFYPLHSDEWVMWSPYSFYDSSFHAQKTGKDRVQWQTDLAGGRQQGLAGVNLRRLRRRADNRQALIYHRPDVISELVSTRSVPNEVLNISGPPQMDLQLAGPSGGPPLRATFSAVPQSPGEFVISRALLLNGLRIAVNRPVAVPFGGRGNIQANLPAQHIRHGINRIIGLAEVRFPNGQTIVFRRVESFVSGPVQQRQPRLFYVGIGVDQPGKRQLPKLRFAGKGARDMGDALAAALGQGRICRNGVPLQPGQLAVLNVHRPGRPDTTVAGINAALHQLAAAAGPEDLAIVFVNGHGEVNQQGQFEFLCSNGVIPQQNLTDLLAGISCRTLLLLDTCHAGAGAGASRQVNLFAGIVNGPLMMTACGGNQESLEHGQIRNGLFTASLLEGLTGMPCRPGMPNFDLNTDGQVSLDEIIRCAPLRTQDIEQGLMGRQTQTPQVLDSVSFDDPQLFTFR